MTHEKILLLACKTNKQYKRGGRISTIEEYMAEAVKTLIKSFSGYSAGVAISRISGMCRDVALAFFFGTSAEIAMFMVAYRFANLMRRMLAESPLSSSFVPTFEGARARDEREGVFLFRDLFCSLTVIVMAIIVCCMGILYMISWLYPMQEGMDAVIHLTQIMFPSLLFISLYGLSSTFLHCERSFFLPAVAPVAFNCVWIIAAWCAHGLLLSEAVKVLAYGVVVAFFMQWIVLMPNVLRNVCSSISCADLFKPRFFHTSLRPMVRPFLTGTLGVGATQINIALDSVFARLASVEGPALLWYAIRIEQVPVALFGVAIGAALLPALARSIKAKQQHVTAELLQQGFKQTFALMTFSTFGLIALGYLVVWTLFGRGEFGVHSVVATSECLWCYALGLIPHGGTLLLASIYYAYGDFKTPMRGAVWAVLLNVTMNALMVFVFKWGAASIALGTSLTSVCNALYLHSHFKQYLKEALVSPLFYIKTLGCGTVAALSAGSLSYVMIMQPHLTSVMRTIGLGVLCCVYLAVYCGMEKIMNCKEVTKLIKAQVSK